MLIGPFLIVAAAGCGGQSEEGTGEPPIGAIATVRSASDIVLPLDEYMPTEVASRTIANAQSILVEQCMAEFGLDFPAVQTSTTVPDSLRLTNARRYFIIDAAAAAVDGYHPSAEARRAQQDIDAQRVQGAALSSDVINVLEGKGPGTFNGRPVPEGGCSKESARKLGGDRIDRITLDVQRLRLESFNRMLSDSRVTAASRTWSACMKEQGFDYPNPAAANDDRRWFGAAPSPEEIATAVADVACKTKTNIAGVMLTVETAYQRRMVDQNVTALNEIKALYETELAGAAQVLATGGK